MLSSESPYVACSSGLSCPLSCSSYSDSTSTGSSLSGVLSFLVLVVFSLERCDLERRRGRRCSDCVPGGLSSTGSSLSSSRASSGVPIIHTSYQEVAIPCLAGSKLWPCPSSSSIPSMSSEWGSGVLVGSSTVAMKWVAGGKQNSPSSVVSSNRTVIYLA
mgnify:CR=1 FL=1